jgi:hypothetical protein
LFVTDIAESSQAKVAERPGINLGFASGRPCGNIRMVPIPSNTHDLLERFIRDKLTPAPARTPRVGIRPDEPRPFNRKKTRAALEHLRLRGDLADYGALARRVGVSRALLLKWRCCEPRFLAAVDAYHKDFVAVAVAEVRDQIAAGDLRAIRKLGDFQGWSLRLRSDVALAVLDSVAALPDQPNLAALTAAFGLYPVVGAGLPEGSELGFWAAYMYLVAMLETEARRRLEAAVEPAQREAFAAVFDGHERVFRALIGGADAITSHDAKARAVFEEHLGPALPPARNLAGTATAGRP